jgi:dTMP kinase
MFVCIEGTDASGKNTQTKLLAKRLHAQLYSFPAYDTPSGELIKAHLQVEWNTQINDSMMWSVSEQNLSSDEYLDAMVFQSLQLTNRMELASRINTHLEAKKHVVADRYWPSGWVYGAADGLEKPWLEAIHAPLPQPDLFILVDVDVEHSFKRRPDRRDRYESDRPFLEKVVKLYRELWHSMRNRTTNLNRGERWRIVDGRGGIDPVHQDIWNIVRDCRLRLEDGTW